MIKVDKALNQAICAGKNPIKMSVSVLIIKEQSICVKAVLRLIRSRECFWLLRKNRAGRIPINALVIVKIGL